MFVAQHIQHVCPTKNPGQDAGAHRRSHSIRHYTLLEKPSGAAESIVQAGLENVEFTVGEGTIAAEVHHVVLNLRSPVVPQSIFGPDAQHPPADGLVDRDRADSHAIHADAGGCACVGPRAAKFAIDEPTIEGVAKPGSERGDPIETRAGVGCRNNPRPNSRRARAVLYSRPRDICFEAHDPLIDLVIEPDLTAAEKAAAVAAAVVVGPPHAEMSAGIESGPVKERDWRRWRPVGRTARRIGGFGYSGRRC